MGRDSRKRAEALLAQMTATEKVGQLNQHLYGFRIYHVEDGKIIFSNKATSLDATSVKKIFNRYYTVENAKKSTGLGLSIAKQLIELNEGNIVARYEQGYLIIEIELWKIRW